MSALVDPPDLHKYLPKLKQPSWVWQIGSTVRSLAPVIEIEDPLEKKKRLKSEAKAHKQNRSKLLRSFLGERVRTRH